MDYYANEMLGHKEEEQHTSGSTTTMAKDILFPKTIGGEHQEGKEEVDDHSITPPMPQPL